jgi:hypothetical protein
MLALVRKSQISTITLSMVMTLGIATTALAPTAASAQWTLPSNWPIKASKAITRNYDQGVKNDANAAGAWVERKVGSRTAGGVAAAGTAVAESTWHAFKKDAPIVAPVVRHYDQGVKNDANAAGAWVERKYGSRIPGGRIAGGVAAAGTAVAESTWHAVRGIWRH